MENQLKWYQKPVAVTLFLIFFFPVGLYLMWKHNLWNKTTRIVISVLFGLIVIANMNNRNNNVNLNSDSNRIEGSIKECNRSSHEQFVINRFKDTGKTVSGMRVEQTYDCGYLILVEGIDYSKGVGFDCYVTTDGSTGEVQIIGTKCETL